MSARSPTLGYFDAIDFDGALSRPLGFADAHYERYRRAPPERVSFPNDFNRLTDGRRRSARPNKSAGGCRSSASPPSPSQYRKENGHAP